MAKCRVFIHSLLFPRDTCSCHMARWKLPFVLHKTGIFLSWKIRWGHIWQNCRVHMVAFVFEIFTWQDETVIHIYREKVSYIPRKCHMSQQSSASIQQAGNEKIFFSSIEQFLVFEVQMKIAHKFCIYLLYSQAVFMSCIPHIVAIRASYLSMPTHIVSCNVCVTSQYLFKGRDVYTNLLENYLLLSV